MQITDEKREMFVKDNLGLVHSCANRFRGRGIEYEDLFSGGCMGLLKAIEAFDDTRGVKFSTYAVPVILGEIKRMFRDGGAVKVSRGLKELSMKASREREKFICKHLREPAISELSELLGVTVEEAAQAITAGMHPVSLTPQSDENESEIDIKVESIEDKITDILSLREAVKSLPEKERKIIVLRYFKNKTQSETAKHLSMTQVQVSRTEKKILEKLKKELI